MDANRLGAAKTTTGALTGTYSTKPDGTGSIAMALDAGMNLTLGTVVTSGGQSLQLVATDFKFPAAICACGVGRVVLTGVARAAPAASIKGTYGFEFNNVTNVNATFGVATLDEAGNISLSGIFVGSSDATGQPTEPSVSPSPGLIPSIPMGRGPSIS